MMKKQKLDNDELGYVRDIRNSISFKEDIRTMQVSFKTLISLGVDDPGPPRNRLWPQDPQGSRVHQAQAPQP